MKNIMVLVVLAMCFVGVQGCAPKIFLRNGVEDGRSIGCYMNPIACGMGAEYVDLTPQMECLRLDRVETGLRGGVELVFEGEIWVSLKDRRYVNKFNPGKAYNVESGIGSVGAGSGRIYSVKRPIPCR